MEATTFIATVVYATIITLKSGKLKVKLHLENAVKQLMEFEETESKDIWLFANQLFEAFLVSTPFNIAYLKANDLAYALRGAKVKLSAIDEDGYTNFDIEKILLNEVGINHLKEQSIMNQLDAKARERRAEAKAEAAAKDAEAAMKALEAEFAEATEPVAETVAEPELTPRQIAARKAAETRRRNREAAAAQA